EGTSETLDVANLFKPTSAEPAPAPPIQAKPSRSFGFWLYMCASLLMPAVIGAAVYVATRPEVQTADLPKWFDPAYRISKKRAILFASKSGGKVKFDGKATAPPSMYDDAWLEEHFTHYVDRGNA